MIGGYGEGGMYGPAEGSTGDRRNFAVAAGAQAQCHFSPFDRWDPWVGAGTGWRGYWMVDDQAGSTVLQGVDIVRAQVGVDHHFSPSFVVSPTVSATLTQFMAESGTDGTGYHRLERRAAGELLLHRARWALRRRRDARHPDAQGRRCLLSTPVARRAVVARCAAARASAVHGGGDDHAGAVGEARGGQGTHGIGRRW